MSSSPGQNTEVRDSACLARILEIRNLMHSIQIFYPLRFCIFSPKDSKELFVPKSSVARHWEEMGKSGKTVTGEHVSHGLRRCLARPWSAQSLFGQSIAQTIAPPVIYLVSPRID